MGEALITRGAPASKDISMTLLWENASPNSSFAPQTISLDLSGYDMVGILLKLSTDTSHPMAVMTVPGRMLSPWYENSGSFRYINADLTGVRVQNCPQGDGNCVPYRIYGMKGVQ